MRPNPAGSLILVILVLLGTGQVPAAAQSTPRGFVTINGGSQLSTTEFEDRFTFTLHQEPGTTRVMYPVEAGPVFDAGGGVRLWRGLGVGLTVSRFARDGAARTETSLPHPFFLQMNRQIAGDAEDIRRDETGYHVQAQYTVPLTRRLHLTLMGGPSLLEVTQTMVLDVNYTEEYPYDTAAFTGVDSNRRKGTKTGFNAGADVRWMFTQAIGAGAGVRISGATIELDAPGGRTVPVDAGGVQAGAGIRFVF